MNKKQYALLVVCTILSGLVGGAVTSVLFVEKPVFAENTSHAEKVIEASEFHLIDKDEKSRGGLSITPDGMAAIYLTDEK